MNDKPTNKRPGKAKKPIRVLFVCTGNTCRSPMAEQIFNHFLTKNKLNQHFKAASAGTNTIFNDTINKNALKAVASLGIKPKTQKAKQISQQKCNNADIIICMSRDHKDTLKDTFNTKDNIYSFSEITLLHDIPDPFGLDVERYELCAKYIAASCEQILTAIQTQQQTEVK